MSGLKAKLPRVLPWVLLATLLAYGTALRAWRLDAAPLWTDEAESAINALTILEHGVPVGSYLGLPVFENTLTRTWPDHPEYEFRDTSYSDRGIAIYHGWLPLYAMAASLALHGIEPDQPRGDPAVRHSPEDMRRRTIAARLPSVLFGIVFLAGAYLAGRELYGTDAGFAALAAACVSTTTVTLARQARYYSLTLALGVLCALVLARIIKRGSRGDLVAGACLFALLFHTNVLAFVSVCGALALLIPDALTRPRVAASLGWCAAIIAAGTIPWMLWSGFMGNAIAQPMARHLLEWRDIPDYAVNRLLFAAIAAAGIAWLFVIGMFSARLPRRIVAPFEDGRHEFLFLAGWATIAFVAFVLLVPAASFFYSRLTLAIVVPSLLFGAMLTSAIARAIAPRHSAWLAAPLFVLLLSAADKAMFWWPALPAGQSQFLGTIEHLRRLELPAGTRLYADAGAALPLSYYTGMPVQNILPVRRTFLDGYPDEVIVVEGPRLEGLTGFEIALEAGRHGVTVTEPQARLLGRAAQERSVRRGLVHRVARVSPPAGGETPVLEPLVVLQEQKTRLAIARTIEESGNPMFRGYAIPDYAALWRVFFYRFVDPDRRSGPGLNYASRVRNGHAQILPGGWVVIRSERVNQMFE